MYQGHESFYYNNQYEQDMNQYSVPYSTESYYSTSFDQRQFGPWFQVPVGRPPGPPPSPPPFAQPGQGPDVGPPTTPPPSFVPAEAQQASAFAVDPGSIRGCLFRFTYVWLRNRQQFWYFPTFVGRRSVSGYRWTGFNWVYFGISLRDIRSFTCMHTRSEKITDYGPNPFVVDIEEVTKNNNTFRTALWTGEHLQLTLMSIGVGEDIGLEQHPYLDQFLRIEEGEGLVQMGDSKNNLNFRQKVSDDFAIFVPAGKWHNLTNTGQKPIKLYSIYSPPEHPFGTVHETKAIAMAAEEDHHH